MRLYIGKNHQGNTAPVQSIFRLVGSDEDALTFALGFLLAHDYNFCAKLVRRLGMAPRHTLGPDYSVYLQEVTERGFGRRDIVIQDSRTRIVVEAKVGDAEPTPEQLLKYVADEKAWTQYEKKRIVALTQGELAAATTEKVKARLPKGIRFSDMQWHEVVDLALSHRPSESSEVSRYLFDEFIRYIRGYYRMGYYDVEILIQDVNPLNAAIFKEGWMYVTSPKDRKAPLYFAPYFTRQGANSGISMISRVKDSEIVVLANKQDVVVNPPSEKHLERWRHGLVALRERAEKEGFAHGETRLFYLDQPIIFRTTPLSKKTYNGTKPSKTIPNQIPKGFSLRFDDLLMHSLGFGEP